ncbi:MAG: hypothetical protein ACLR4Z_14725 [Butyricicoccaceae bacterium]
MRSLRSRTRATSFRAASTSACRLPARRSKRSRCFRAAKRRLWPSRCTLRYLKLRPAPFCVLDEIEAALDDVNVQRYAKYIRKLTDFTQFIVITHRRGTMEEADMLYGVTMQEQGVSKLLMLNLAEAEKRLKNTIK